MTEVLQQIAASLAALLLSLQASVAVLPATPAAPSPEAAVAGATTGRWMTGYYTANSMNPALLPWTKYTHLIHFGMVPRGTGLDMQWMSDANMKAFISARPSGGAKALLGIKDAVNGPSGGYHDPNAFNISTSPANIDQFAQNIADTVNNYGYDGVDLDWEINVNVTQYQNLINKLRSKLGSAKIIVMAAHQGDLADVAAGTASQLDQVNVMCYDLDYDEVTSTKVAWFNGATWQAGSGHRACDWRLSATAAKGVPAAKLGAGVPFYGREWYNCAEPLQTGCALSDSNNQQHYHDLVKSSLWAAHQKYSATYGSEYLSAPETSPRYFVSYNGVNSMAAAAKLISDKGYGGAMAFTVEYDYVDGWSEAAQYPLSTALSNAMGNVNTIVSPTTNTSTDTAVANTTTSVNTAAAPASADPNTIRINAGGASSDYTAKDGKVWLKDRYYKSGEVTYNSGVSAGDFTLYATGRQGLYTDFSYSIPVANGNYKVNLIFVEHYKTAAGQRIFNVSVNGTKALSNFDILSETASLKPLAKTFSATATDGKINIDFTGVKGRGIVSAIEIVPENSAVTALSQTTTVTSSQTQTSVTSPSAAPIYKFSIGNRAHTTTGLNTRQQPLIANNQLCIQPLGSYGTVLAGPQQGSGYTWWQIDYDSFCDGWSAENWLAK